MYRNVSLKKTTVLLLWGVQTFVRVEYGGLGRGGGFFCSWKEGGVSAARGGVCWFQIDLRNNTIRVYEQDLPFLLFILFLIFLLLPFLSYLSNLFVFFHELLSASLFLFSHGVFPTGTYQSHTLLPPMDNVDRINSFNWKTDK